MERTGERVKHERSNPSSLSGSTYSSGERTEGDEEGAVHMPSFFEWSERSEESGLDGMWTVRIIKKNILSLQPLRSGSLHHEQRMEGGSGFPSHYIRSTLRPEGFTKGRSPLPIVASDTHGEEVRWTSPNPSASFGSLCSLGAKGLSDEWGAGLITLASAEHSEDEMRGGDATVKDGFSSGNHF